MEHKINEIITYKLKDETIHLEVIPTKCNTCEGCFFYKTCYSAIRNIIETICVAEGVLQIADNFDNKKQCEASKINTFIHEVVHGVLDTMGESELSKNEKFVCTFASFVKWAYIDDLLTKQLGNFEQLKGI